MIIEQNKHTVETYGDVERNKVSIDPRNAEHIISILSSNLYSNPEESFLRETISNAIDSHREAGTKEPVILSIKPNGSKYNIIVRDYGTGISPERFDQIYRYIGSSTKRESNEYIGHFGIGRFSALAVADVVNITSYYNGTANAYIMAKNGRGIDIDLVASLPTEEKNGVEIKIEVSDLWEYKSALKSLVYIDELYIDSNILEAEDFNNRAIKKFNNFCCTNYYDKDIQIILGNILYKIDYYKVESIIKSIASCNYWDLKETFNNIQVPFNIGDLDVVPNRESLMYSEKTLNALKDKYLKVVEELKTMYDNYLSNCSIIEKVVRAKWESMLPIEVEKHSINLNMGWYKGSLDSKDLQVVERFLTSSLSRFPFTYVLTGEKGCLTKAQKDKTNLASIIYKRRNRYSGYTKRASFKIIRLGDFEKGRPGKYLKSYIEEYYCNSIDDVAIFIPNYKLSTLYKYWEQDFAIRIPITNGDGIVIATGIDYLATRKVFIQVIKAFKDKFCDLDIEHSQEFLDWKEEKRASVKANNSTITISTEGFPIEVTYNEGYADYRHKDKVNNALEAFRFLPKVKKKPVLYAEINSPYWHIFEALFKFPYALKFNLVKVSKTNMKYMKGLPKNWIPLEEYLFKSSKFAQYLSYRKIKENVVELDDNSKYALECLIPFMVKEDSEKVKRFSEYLKTKPCFTIADKENLNELLTKFKEANLICDTQLKSDLETYNKYAKIVTKVKHMSSVFGNWRIFSYYLMKQKLFRMCFSEYDYLKTRLKIKVE